MMHRILVLFITLTMTLFAIEGNIKVSIKPYDKLYSSQKMTLYVELMSSAFSITDSKIEINDSSDYIVQAPNSAAYTQSIEINESDWQMVHYEYTLYPLHSGKIEIKPFDISFSASMGYGQKKKAFTFKTEALHFNVDTQEGVKKGSFVLSTDNYEVTSTLKPKVKRVIVGTAIELSVTQKALGVPDILLKPVSYTSTPLLRVYDKEPVLKSGLKGNFDVSRSDHFTFVAIQEGNVSIAAKELIWWDTKHEKIMREKIPAIDLEIITDPQIAIDAKNKAFKETMYKLAVTFLIIVVLLVLLYPKIKRHLALKKLAFEKSEKGKFETLLKSVEHSPIKVVYKNFYAWLESIDVNLARGGFGAIARRYPEYAKGLEVFEKALLSSEPEYDKNEMLSKLKSLREKVLDEHTKSEWALMEKLNP